MNRSMSLKARARNTAEKWGIPAHAVLQNYMMEALLLRIANSRYHDNFILKGGMLIATLIGIGYRTTMDIDTTVRFFPLSEESLSKIVNEIFDMPAEDQIVFSLKSVTPIRKDDHYAGFRLSINANLGRTSQALKMDVSAGDVLSPGPVNYSFQTHMNETVRILAYNIETLLAEKIETILQRSIANTRMRDYYDVYIILETQRESIDPGLFSIAVHETARHRKSMHAIAGRNTILSTLKDNKEMETKWRLYASNNSYSRDVPFEVVIDSVEQIIDWIIDEMS